MARTYRRRGYSRTYRRSRWPYRSWRRAALTRVSQAGNRRFNVSIPCQASFSMSVTEGKYWTSTNCMSPYLSQPPLRSRGSLLNSVLYRTYCGLYDQVKINSVYVRISLMSLVGSGGVVPALRFVTAWDRDCYYNDLIGTNLPAENALEVGSESQVTLIVNNSRAIISRYNKANDIQERTVFHDCSLVSVTGGTYNDEFYAAGKPVGYSPGLLFSINTATAPGTGQQFTFNVALDVRWNVTFRNPKYGLSTTSSSSSSSSSKSVGFDELQKQAVEEIKAAEDVKDEEVLPDVETGAKKFDALSDEEKARIMELVGSMEDEKGAT